jgi:hypothetical protein
MLLMLGVRVGRAGIEGMNSGLPTLVASEGILLMLGVRVGLAGMKGSCSFDVSGILLTLERRG